MERLKYEIPSLDRKQDAIDFINEFYEYNSEINGVGGLNRYLDNYEDWLKKLENDYTMIPNGQRVPARTYFLVRESDNKIVGMSNLRLDLTEWLLENGGHIGYCIRPTERRKGYNKINLYLSLLEAKKHELDNVLLTASENNLGSVKTIEALGGILENKIPDYEDETVLMGRYWINVDESIEKYKNLYEQYIVKEKVR